VVALGLLVGCGGPPCEEFYEVPGFELMVGSRGTLGGPNPTHCPDAPPVHDAMWVGVLSSDACALGWAPDEEVLTRGALCRERVEIFDTVETFDGVDIQRWTSALTCVDAETRSYLRGCAYAGTVRTDAIYPSDPPE